MVAILELPTRNEREHQGINVVVHDASTIFYQATAAAKYGDSVLFLGDRQSSSSVQTRTYARSIDPRSITGPRVQFLSVITYPTNALDNTEAQEALRDAFPSSQMRTNRRGESALVIPKQTDDEGTLVHYGDRTVVQVDITAEPGERAVVFSSIRSQGYRGSEKQLFHTDLQEFAADMGTTLTTLRKQLPIPPGQITLQSTQIVIPV